MRKFKFTTATSTASLHGDLSEALSLIETTVVAGLRHGFFNCSISCKVGTGGRREITVAGGLSHKINIPEDELPR